jgi:hypothetical protein
MDSYLTDVCCTRTMGDVAKTRETASNAKAWVVNSMILNAVFEQDIDLIKTIITRVDGLVPDEGDRGGYANILGDALDDVLSLTEVEALNITPSDPVIIALAKVLVHTAARPTGSNYMQRKQRNLAASMILERTGGRKTGPTRPTLETKYVEPDWMGLPDGDGRE